MLKLHMPSDLHDSINPKTNPKTNHLLITSYPKTTLYLHRKTHLTIEEVVDPVNMAVIMELRRQRHLADRLAHEDRWAWQYAIMLPTFLRRRLETSNWGNRTRWNHDARPPCHCAMRTERDVDLVDLLSRERVKVSFCKNCDLSDPVRLLQMGYMASSPKQPRTAFSLRLLKHHHAVWLRCAVSTQGFCEALDDTLDDDNPLIVTSKMKPRDWRLPFTEAVNAYRAIILQIRKIEDERLQLSELEKLAVNCPKCFGPHVGEIRPKEPEVIICLDGNFQHKRHAAASVPIPGFEPPRPEIFLDPKLVERKARHMAGTPDDADEVDPCTEAHTTANDVRGKSHFKSMDESGLLGMACRHDHVLKLINLIQTGEKSHLPLALVQWLLDLFSDERDVDTGIGILYDIGCNLDKTIKKKKVFTDEKQAAQVRVGTALFHAYAHNWGCQLEYNPRLNEGWGKSNAPPCKPSPLVNSQK